MKIAIYHAVKPPRREFGGDLGTQHWYNQAIEDGHDVNWVENISENKYVEAGVYMISDVAGFDTSVINFLASKKNRVFVAHQTYPYVNCELPIFKNNLAVIWLAPNQKEHNTQIQGTHDIVTSVYIDHTKFQNLGRKKRRKSKLYVGEIAPHKISQKMIKEMRDSECHYHLYGSTENHPEFVKELSMMYNVQIKGRIDQKDMPYIYNQYETFYWKIDRYGNFGRTNVEALLCGCTLDIDFENFGLFSFDVVWNSRDAITDWLETDKKEFWGRIDKLL